MGERNLNLEILDEKGGFGKRGGGVAAKRCIFCPIGRLCCEWVGPKIEFSRENLLGFAVWVMNVIL